jgi:type IX secretion system PorP/SprF family membrane protein
MMMLWLALLPVNKIIAQIDPHFTQYYAYPTWLNPGMAGVINNGDYRITAVYRNQWASVAQPFTTAGLSADIATKGNWSFGGSFLKQAAGDGGYQYNTGYVTIAYSGVKWGADQNNVLSIGLQGGLINRRFDPNKLQFGDQWIPGVGYSPSTPTGEPLQNLSRTVFDFGAGIAYYNSSSDQPVNFFGGIAAAHLTKPADPFIANNKSYLPVRYTSFAGARIQTSETVAVLPHIVYLLQGNAHELTVGSQVELNVNEETSVLTGANYRVKDAINLLAGISYKNLVLGLSYDFTNSSLSKMIKPVNSFEISITLTGKRLSDVNTNYYKCPRL